MKREWIRLIALLALVSWIARAEMSEAEGLSRLAPGAGQAAAPGDGRLRVVGMVGDEPGSPVVAVQDFGLVSEKEGWVISGSSLYWTQSGGQAWRDLSPVAGTGLPVLEAFFLDASRGWAVTKAVERSGPEDYILARTTDAGTRWEEIPLHLFPPGQMIAPASAIYLHFINADTGWLVVRHASGSNFSVGTLFGTSNGGRTWTQLSIPIGEPVYFMNDHVGWTAGGAAGNELYRTTDAGASWQQQNVAPVSASAAQARFYRLPRFWNAREGLLPVVATGERTQLELYASHDGGAQWELTAEAPLRQSAAPPDGLPLALIPRVRAAMVLADGNRMVIASAGGELTASVARRDGAGEITRLEMVTPDAGWATQTFGTCTPPKTPPGGALSGPWPEPGCRSVTRLLGTVDGGRTWTTLPLPQAASSGTIKQPEGKAAPAESPAAMTGLRQEHGTRTTIFIGQGFDKCEVASIAQLGTWIVQSPYGAVNLYIGGAGRACSNTALTASLVSELGQLGWRFIPTWVGPQAPCYPYSKPRMSSEPAIARAQGVDEANAAADVAAGLGLANPDGSGSIVYYDMEHYDTADAACHAAVREFVSGWTGQLQARGSLAGVYANGPPLNTFTTLSHIPDAIWPAHWIFSSYDPSATVWDVYGLSNELWNDHQRIRQYAGGHVETWGGVSLNIDCDVIDGIVASIAQPSLDFTLYLPLMSSTDQPVSGSAGGP